MILDDDETHLDYINKLNIEQKYKIKLSKKIKTKLQIFSHIWMEPERSNIN